MKEKDKVAFKKQLAVRKNSTELLGLFKAIERCDITKEPKGIIKRLLIFKNGKDKRLYNRLKAQLFEFEITSKRVDYFKHQDSHTYLLFELKKSFLTAQMLTERDAYLTSIHIMTETYRKAEKFEFLDIQKSCADNLNSYYALTGNIITADYWSKESKRLNKELISYHSLHHIFEKKLQHIDCCEFHRKASSESFDKASSELFKTKWMLEAIAWKDSPNRDKIDVSFNKSLALFREIKENPGVYPRDFNVSATKFLFEDLYRLGKHSLLTKFAGNIGVLNRLPVYQRLPLINFFLFFLLKSSNSECLEIILENITKEKAYHHFQPFKDHVFKIEVLHLITANDYRSALKNLNRNNEVFKHCEYNDFDYRLLEMICLYKLQEWSVIEDKLESFRRFTFRNPNLRDSSYCLIMFNSMRSLILHNTLDSGILSVKQEKNVYDLRDFLAGIVMSLTIKKAYAKKSDSLLKVAESKVEIKNERKSTN